MTAASWLEDNFDVKIKVQILLSRSAIFYYIRQLGGCLFNIASYVTPVKWTCRNYCLDNMEDANVREYLGCTSSEFVPSRRTR